MLQPDKLKKLNENAAKMAAEGSSEQEILAMRDAFIKQFGTEKTALVKKKVASDSSLEDGSSESQKISSRRKDMPQLTEEGFAEGMKKASRSPEELQKKQEASSFKKGLQKGKEKGAVLKNANESALNTESPFEQSYKQDTVNTYEALGVPKKEEPTQLESFLGVPEEVQKNQTEALNTFKPSKEKIVEEYNKLDLDNPKPYISSSTYNRQPENGIQINKDSFVDDIFGDDKLLKSGIDPADFDGFLNLSGFKDQYIDRKKRGDFDPSIKSDHDAKLADDLYKNKMLSAYVNTLNDRAVLKSKLTSVIGSYDGKKIPVNKQARVLDNSVISEYIDENLPSLSKKLKEKDELNKEKYKELTNDNTGLNSFWIGSKNTLKGGYNSFVDAVNKSTSTILDLVGAEDLADDARYLNEERQLERPTERQVAFASGKVVNLNGKKYLVDEKGTIYDKDNEIVVNDLLDENTYKNILNKSNESKEEDWFISPQGAAVQTGNVLGDMIWQIAYQGVAGNVTKGIGAASYLNKIKIPKPTADAIIAQSSLGYSQAYEQTLKEAKDAGLTDKESEEIASDAAQRTALWYAVTAPISPQTKATEALFGSAEKSMIKNAISAYKEKGKQGFISSITKGLKEIPKKAAEFSEEGLKETVQENIQQAGESYIINAQKNIDAGKEISNETMSFDDFINTSILSFLSAGTVASLNVPNFSSNKKMQIRNLYELSQNMDVLDSNLKQMVENKIITKEDAEKVRTDAIAVSRNITKIPKNTNPDVQLDLVRKLNDIDNLENKKNELDKSFHPDVDKQIDKIRGEISSVYNESLTKKEETNAVQEQSTTEIPVQSEARISEQVAERVSKPKSEITTEQGTQEEVVLSDILKLSDEDLEKRQAELEEKGFKTFSKESKEFNEIDKELEKREWQSVLNAPLNEVIGIVDNLIIKDKEMPNGYGSYIEKSDAKQTKEIAKKYSQEVSKLDAKKDFKDAFFGRPESWYADALKMRESVRVFTEKGGSFKELLQGIQIEFEQDGFSEQDAAGVIKSKLDKISKANETTTETQTEVTQPEITTEQGTQEEVAQPEVVTEQIAEEEVSQPVSEKINVLGQEVDMYTNYLPSKENVEENSIYVFRADNKDKLPEVIRDKATVNTSEINGVKSETWSASIDGKELNELYANINPEMVAQEETTVEPVEAQAEATQLKNEKIKGGENLSGTFLNDKQLTYQESFDLANSELKEIESKERTLPVQKEYEAKIKEIDRIKELASEQATQAEATQPQTIIDEQVTEDVVKVKKSPDFMNDAEHIVTLNGEEAGRMYYDRSSKTWRDPNFDRSKHSPESFERIYGDILGDTKQEATDELIRRRKESMKQETPVEESVTEEVVSKEPQGVQFSKDTILNKFLNKLNSLNPIQKNPIDNKSFIYGDKASLEFNRFDKGDKNEISLEGITSLDKGKGLGKEAMVDITKSADELGTTLTLDAKPFGREGLGKKELINFYKKNGFEVDQQYLEDLDFASEQEAIDYVLENESEALPMIRKPQQQAVSEQAVEEVNELLELDTKDKDGLQRVLDYLDRLDSSLDLDPNELNDVTRVMAIGTAKAVVKTLKALVKAGIKLKEAINTAAEIHSVEPKDVLKAFDVINQGGKQKSAPSPLRSDIFAGDGRIISILKDVNKITMREKDLLAKQLRDKARGARESIQEWKKQTKQLTEDLDELVRTGKISVKQSSAILKKFAKVNIFSRKSVDRFTDYMVKVINKADYVSKLAEARKTLSSIKSLSKNEDKNINLRTVGKEFSKIEPSMVEDIEEYNNIASKLKTAIDGSKARGKDVKIADTINIDEVSSYIEKTITEQEEKLRQEKIDEIQNLFGVDASKFSEEEIDAMLEEDSDKANDNEKIIRAAAKKAFDIYSTVIKEMIKTGVDPFTDEEVSFTEEEKGLIEKFMDIDTDTVADPKEVLRMVDSLINFIQNKSTAGMLKPIADYSSVLGGNEIVKQKLIAKKLRKYWIPSLGLSLSKQFTTTPVLFDKLFKGINRALIVEDLSGISDLIRNVSLTQTQANKIAKKYVKEFYKKQANGDAFNTLFNDIERGVFAHVLRTSLGDESKSKSIFEKRKKEVLEVVKILREKGDDSESKIAEVVEKVYNKILDGSESIEDVKKKVDKTNAEAVDFWIKEWSNIYDPLRDLAVNFYNKSLERDFNFTPDRFRKLKDKMGNEDLEDIQSQFLANTDEILYDKKSGSLIDKQENRKIPKDMYIDFSFDKKNANAMYDALMDLNTAYDLRKVGSFLKSDNFRKIFPSRNEARLVDRRIKKYVRISRKKMPYSGDDIESSLKALDKLTKIGVSMSLASVKQPFVQTIPIMFSTAVNAGGTGLSAVVDKDYNKWLDDLGYAISNRGSEAQLEVESLNKLIEKAAESKSEKVFKYIEELNDKALKMMLSNPDIWIARASFKAYYEQYLKKHGEESNIDYSSHKVNKDAANYAQRMIDRQQGISDHALAGDIFTSDNKITRAFVKMIMPFSSFRMNQSSRLSSDLSTLEYWNTSTKEDKIIAMRSIAGYTLEAVAYRSLQVSFGVLMNIIANKIMDDDDDEDDKKYLETSLKGAVQGFGVDTFSSIPALDFAIQDLLALGAEGVQELMEVPEEKKIELFYSEKQSALKYFGTYGIPIERAKEIFELGKLAYTREYEDKYGNKKKITEKNADRLKPLVGVAFASSVFRLANPDITSVIRKSIKLAKKNNSLYMENLKEKNPEKYKRIKEKIKSFKEKALKRKER